MRAGRAATVAAAAVAALLVGCATRPADEPSSPWISGRLAVRVDAAGNASARSATAAFEMRGSGERGELRLLSPLGTLIAETRWTAADATIQTPEGRRHFNDLDSLSRELLGEVLPLRALPDWLQGRPWSGAASTVMPQGFEQLGWQIQLAQQAEGSIEARRASPPAVMLRVRLDR